jgi:hypothetical protein
MQHSAAGAVNRPGIFAGQLSRVSRIEFFGGIHVRQAFPALANADYVTPHLSGAVHHRLDHRVQTGYVASARQNSDAGSRSHESVAPWGSRWPNDIKIHSTILLDCRFSHKPGDAGGTAQIYGVG